MFLRPPNPASTRVEPLEGVAMKRWMWIVAVLAGLWAVGGKAEASWSEIGYSGYQPWYNIFAQRYKCLTPEEARLQKFWHDYYDALKHYYDALDHIDWVAYYKNHGYQINGGCGGPAGGCGRINYAPVFVNPQLSWAVPHQNLQGPIQTAGFQVPPPEGYPQGGQMMPPPGYPQGGQMVPPGYGNPQMLPPGYQGNQPMPQAPGQGAPQMQPAPSGRPY
jgi:hypothetical protein